MEKREYEATEFWTLIILAVIWLFDRWFGASLLDQVNLNAVTDAKVEVLKLAADLRGEDGSNSNLLVYVGSLIYAGRKAEKIFAAWRRESQ